MLPWCVWRSQAAGCCRQAWWKWLLVLVRWSVRGEESLQTDLCTSQWYWRSARGPGAQRGGLVVPLASLPNVGGNGSNKKYIGVCRQGGVTKVLMRNIPSSVLALLHPPELPLLSRVIQERVPLLCPRGRCLMVDNYNHRLLFSGQSNNEKFPCCLPMK